MGKLFEKAAHAAHLKKGTKGTSNEISFSVLDAAKEAMDDDKGSSTHKRAGLGAVSLFTLGRKKKPVATPTKEKGLHLSSGGFVSAENGGPSDLGTPSVVAPSTPLNAPSKDSSSVKAPALPIGSSRGSAGDSRPWRPPADEVARKKKARKRRRALAITCCVLVAAVAIGFGATTFYAAFQTQQGLRDRLVSILDNIESADQTLVQFDEIVVSQINTNFEYIPDSDNLRRYAEIEPTLDDAYEKLVAARRHTEQVVGYLTDEKDKNVANETIAAINARLNMLSTGQAIMEASEHEMRQCVAIEEAWTQLLVADGIAREAASLVTDTTKESVAASTEKSREAIEEFTQASYLFSQAQNECSCVDFTGYQEYIDLRQEALEHAIASNDAYLARDKEKTAAENDAYNELDAQAAALARELGSDPIAVVEETTRTDLELSIATYASQRDLAGTSDIVLREFQLQA